VLRRVVVGLAAGALGALVAATPAVPAATGGQTLRILVTNDDGVAAPGLDALVEALRKVPDVEVTVAAPAANKTGSGDHASPDPASLQATTTTTASGYPAFAVDGFPADAVVWALHGGVPSRPDVVVSGINAGENLGALMYSSGTVGAARTAARLGVPALAMSQGNPKAPDYSSGARRAVAWVKRRRTELLRARGRTPGPLVDVDIMNVPTCNTGAIRGLMRVPIASVPPKPADCTSTASKPRDDVTAFANGFVSLSETQSTTVCARFADVSDPSAALADAKLAEVSGVVASRAHPPVLWVHNDSGGEPAVYAVSPVGASLGAYPIEGATAIDWEDIAIGPGPERGTSYLYLGDIGDNTSSRKAIVVYRVAEPEAAPNGSGETLTGAEKFTLHYPNGAVDAESLLVDPQSGDLFVIDKPLLSAVGTVYRVPRRRLVDGADVTMRRVASFQLSTDSEDGAGLLLGTLITGADVSPDGSLVLVRTYRRLLAFARPAGQPLASAFSVDACSAPQADERQGEAIAFTIAPDTGYVTTSEGVHAPIHTFAVRQREPTSMSASASRSSSSSSSSDFCASTCTRGRMRSSHFGIHQFQSPSSSIVEGTSTSRTTVASTSTATARPSPMIFSATSGPKTKLPKTHTMIAAAAVMTRAVNANPSATAVALSPLRSYSSRMRDSRNTS
jgi:5'/3'-nucleotidase SurE